MTFTFTLSNVQKWPTFHFIPDSVHTLCSENWKGDQGYDFWGQGTGQGTVPSTTSLRHNSESKTSNKRKRSCQATDLLVLRPKEACLNAYIDRINSPKIGQDTPRYKKTLRQSLTHPFMAWPYITLKLPCIDLPCQSREKAKEIVATRNTSTKSHLRHFTHPQPILF